MLTAEDDVSDTVRPRLDVVGADEKRYEVITGAMTIDTITGKPVLDAVSLVDDLPLIEAAIIENGATLLVVDPLSSYAQRDMNKTVETRALLDSLAAVANRADCAIAIVTHLNKRGDARRAMDLVAGSHVIAAAARAVYATARDPADAKRRLMLPLKCNLAKASEGFAYALIEATHAVCGSMPRVEWEKVRYAGASADEALVDQAPRERARTQKTAEARELLTDLLSGGPVPSEVLWRQVKDAGITQKVAGEVLRQLGATNAPSGYQGSWLYRLPTGSEQAG
jgi:RecA-family ATPase